MFSVGLVLVVVLGVVIDITKDMYTPEGVKAIFATGFFVGCILMLISGAVKMWEIMP